MQQEQFESKKNQSGIYIGILYEGIITVVMKHKKLL